MEELPPYTRYPEQSYPSNQAEASSNPATTRPPSEGAAASQPPNIPGAGGIGIATRDPEYSSTEENLPAARVARSADESDLSQGEINTAARDFAEKLSGGKWQRRARKKFLGVIPYWAICLLIVGLLVVGIVMGAVLGILLSDNNKGKPDGDE